MSPTRNPTRALAAGLAATTLAAPLALADDPPSTRAQQRSDIAIGGVRAPDRLARDSPTPAAPPTRPRTPDAPIVVEVTRAPGFDWTSAAIGAGGGIALVLIALAGVATVSSKSRAPPH